MFFSPTAQPDSGQITMHAQLPEPSAIHFGRRIKEKRPSADPIIAVPDEARTEFLASSPLAKRRNRAAKRAFDLGLGVPLAVGTLPIQALAAYAAYLEDGFNPLFIQERVGKDGRPVRVAKIRTMKQNHNGSHFTAKKDDRVTRVGRLLRRSKIDELPQIWQVLKGDLSLVGPRVQVPTDFENCPALARQLVVKPGITSWPALEEHDRDPDDLTFDLRRAARNREDVLGWSLREDGRVVRATAAKPVKEVGELIQERRATGRARRLNARLTELVG